MASTVSVLLPGVIAPDLADIAGASNTVSSDTGSRTTNTLAGFTGVPVSTGNVNSGNGGSGSGNSGFTWGGCECAFSE